MAKSKPKKAKTAKVLKTAVAKSDCVNNSYPVTITTVLVAVLFTLTVLYAIEYFIWA